MAAVLLLFAVGEFTALARTALSPVGEGASRLSQCPKTDGESVGFRQCQGLFVNTLVFYALSVHGDDQRRFVVLFLFPEDKAGAP